MYGDGSYAAALGKIDAIVFTAGIGENVSSIRTQITSGLEFMGVKIDEEKNAKRGEALDISTADATAQAEIDFENFSEKEFETKAKANVYGKIETQVKKDALKNVKAEIKADPSKTFPYTEDQDFSAYGITATITASKTHDRRYYLGTDYLGRDMLSRIVYGSRVSIGIGLVGAIFGCVVSTRLMHD